MSEESEGEDRAGPIEEFFVWGTRIGAMVGIVWLAIWQGAVEERDVPEYVFWMLTGLGIGVRPSDLGVLLQAWRGKS